MDNKKYLKWYNKIGYGAGDIAGNVVYAFLATFVMIYLTDTAGLNAGIVGTLMMVSKIFDGITDIIFGSLIDKTKTKMGKARPWMLWPYIGCSLMLIAIFAVPLEWGDVANAAVQPESCINMLHFMYLWLPMILNLLITILLSRLTVEKANEDWDKTHSN